MTEVPVPAPVGSAPSRVGASAIAIEILSRALCFISPIYLFLSPNFQAAFVKLYPPFLLMAASEVLTLLFIVFARLPRSIDRRAQAILVVMVASELMTYLKFSPGWIDWHPLVLLPLMAMQLIGVCTQLTGKIWLGRSFGLLPANRGIVTSGPYKLVRHPIYAGYLFNNLAFLVITLNPFNLIVHASVFTFQVIRIRLEEAVLLKDPEYAEYAQRVHYRLIPGVW